MIYEESYERVLRLRKMMIGAIVVAMVWRQGTAQRTFEGFIVDVKSPVAFRVAPYQSGILADTIPKSRYTVRLEGLLPPRRGSRAFQDGCAFAQDLAGPFEIKVRSRAKRKRLVLTPMSFAVMDKDKDGALLVIVSWTKVAPEGTPDYYDVSLAEQLLAAGFARLNPKEPHEEKGLWDAEQTARRKHLGMWGRKS